MLRNCRLKQKASCLEGFHSTLNGWHPKMTHFSWLGTCCSHTLAVLHFNENLNREPKMTKNGTSYYSVTYPKFKFGEEVVRNVPLAPSYNEEQDTMQINARLAQEQETASAAASQPKKTRCCRKCGQPMKEHPINQCPHINT